MANPLFGNAIKRFIRNKNAKELINIYFLLLFGGFYVVLDLCVGALVLIEALRIYLLLEKSAKLVINYQRTKCDKIKLINF